MILASHHDLLCVSGYSFLVLGLACVYEVLDVLERVVVEAAAESIVGAHQESQAVKVIGGNFHLVGVVMGEEVLEEAVTLHP